MVIRASSNTSIDVYYANGCIFRLLKRSLAIADGCHRGSSAKSLHQEAHRPPPALPTLQTYLRGTTIRHIVIWQASRRRCRPCRPPSRPFKREQPRSSDLDAVHLPRLGLSYSGSVSFLIWFICVTTFYDLHRHISLLRPFSSPGVSFVLQSNLPFTSYPIRPRRSLTYSVLLSLPITHLHPQPQPHPHSHPSSASHKHANALMTQHPFIECSRTGSPSVYNACPTTQILDSCGPHSLDYVRSFTSPRRPLSPSASPY